MKKYIFASSSRYDLISNELEPLRETPKTLVFVPSSKVEYPFRLVQEEQIIERLNLNLKEVISLVDEIQDWPSIISRADILYLHGGNPLVFKEYLKEKEVWDLIAQFEGTIIGLSAGAMLMSEHIILVPTNEEYPEFIRAEAFGFAPINVYVHMNFKEVIVSNLTNFDGNTRIQDLIIQSKKCPITLLSDDHFIIASEDTVQYIGDYFYKIENEQIFTLLNKEWVLINYQENNLNEATKVTNFERVFESIDQALQEGYYQQLAQGQEQFYFSFFGLDERGTLDAQLNLPDKKTWVINHPEFKYATLSLQEIQGRVVERFRFKTRYLFIFEQFKVWPKLLSW